MSSLIEVKHLKKYYNKGEIKALDDVSVNIERGDVMVVIGPSGSGKSTLLRSLNLLEVPTAGEIDFDGVDITKKKVKTRPASGSSSILTSTGRRWAWSSSTSTSSRT